MRVVLVGLLAAALAVSGSAAGSAADAATVVTGHSAAPSIQRSSVERVTSGASEVVGPVTPGVPTVLTVPAGSTQDWTFTAARGQYVRLSVGQATGRTSYCGLEIAVIGPDEATLYDGTCVLDGAQLDRATPTRSGEHRIRVTNQGTTPVQVPVTVTVARDRRLSLAPGTPTTVSVSQPGQQVVQTLTASKGQVPTLTVQGSPFSSYDLKVVLRDSLGRQLGTSYAYGDYAWQALPADGTYTLTVSVTSGATGSFTETLGLSVPVVYALTRGVGQPIAPVGDGTVRLTFRGVVGQSAVLRLDRPTWDSTYVWLVSPDGFGIASGFVYGTTGGIDFGMPLSSTGRYTVLLRGGLQQGATATVDTGSPSSGGALVPGRATTVAVTRAGSSRTLTFDGQTGEHPVLATADASWGDGTAQAVLRRPDGSMFGVLGVSQDAPFAELPVLDATGGWTITVDPDLAATGSVSLTLALVPDQVVDVVPGTPVHVAVDRPGQNVRLRFPVRVGERVTLRTTGSSWTSGDQGPGYLSTSLLVPGGAESVEYLSSTAQGSSFSATQDPLLAAGTWTLLVDPYAAAVGSADLVVSAVTDSTATLPRGSVGTLAVTQPGQVVTGLVTVPYGARLTARLVSSSWSGSAGYAPLPALQVRQSGNDLGTLDFADDPAGSFARTAPSSMVSTSWSIIIDPTADVTGSVTLVLDTVRDLVVAASPGRSTSATVSKPGQSVRFTLPVGSGQQLPWSATSAFTGQASVAYDGDPYPAYVGDIGPQATTGTLVSSVTGSVAFVVSPYGGQTGKVSVRLG